ncbi:MAG: Uncharacterized protein XD98_0129 [Microgenomates bacterium 39_6]|nr:MAG: Uncharacterized protein XD98_0129 [Microgenomates bacterium 39_6]
MKLINKLKWVLWSFFSLHFLLALAFWLSQKLPKQSGLFWGKNFGEFVNQPFLWTRANFDGFHYLKIARDGYGFLQAAFFPLFPLLIKAFQSFFASYLLSGWLIVNLAFIIMIWAFRSLLEIYEFDKKTINRLSLILVFFPTSFYFLSLYNEGLFLALVFFSFYQAKKGRWVWAGLLAGLSSATRVVGIFMLPALLVEFCQQNKWSFKIILNKKNWPQLVGIITSALGLLAYMAYLKKGTGDWLRFVTVQSDFGAQRTTNRLIILPQVFWRYLKMLLTVDPNQYIFFNVCLEVAVALLFLFLLVWGWYRHKEYKIQLSWLVFASLAYLLPTLTGTFSSMPRYVLVCFPGFIVLENLLRKKKGAYYSYLILSAVGLIVLAAFFFRGYWLA